MQIRTLVLMALVVATGAACGEKPRSKEVAQPPKEVTPAMPAKQEPQAPAKLETAILGAGCFWCVEAVYQELKGVVSVESGYINGTVDNPSYEQVCTGGTGHAEVCQIKFDPALLSFKDVLEVFWKVHDPTTLNSQGADHGTQYRSGVFYTNPEQKALAEKLKKELDASGAWSKPIVTEIVPAATFWKAEEYHQNYFKTHPTQGYCKFVIAPKMDKFRHVFESKLK
jgi:peptide-methionine (S)-S-oxide reductase